MCVFIHIFYIHWKGGKCRGNKFTFLKCLKVRFPNLDSSQTISALARAEKYLGLEKCTFQHVNNYFMIYFFPDRK